LKSAWTLFSRIADPLCRNEQCLVAHGCICLFLSSFSGLELMKGSIGENTTLI